MKCWGVGAVLSFVAIASALLAHTVFQILGLVLGLPLYLVTYAIARRPSGYSNFVLLFFVGSLFYSVISISLAVLDRELMRGRMMEVQPPERLYIHERRRASEEAR